MPHSIAPFSRPPRLSLALLIALSACSRSDSDAPGASSNTTDPTFSYETVVTGLAVPWAIEFAPDGRVFVTERPGRIRIIRNWTLQPEPWAEVAVVGAGETGLMGLALSPGFANDGLVYVVGTFYENGIIFNRVMRYRDDRGRGVEPTTIIDRLPAAEFHAGDAIEFGPDGMLYVATGDAGDPGAADDIDRLNGKILRYNPDGSIPADNPVPGSPVWARGLRNVQGLDWNQDGQLFASEHGPSGFPNERFRRNDDELNAIVRRGHYGWPDVAGESRDDAFIAPLVTWSPAIAPSGLAIYEGDVQAIRGNAFLGGLRGQQLRRVVLEKTATGYRATRDQALFRERLGRIRAVTMGPDGHLYFATSNWDGRGDPRDGDDRILRLIVRSD